MISSMFIDAFGYYCHYCVYLVLWSGAAFGDALSARRGRSPKRKTNEEKVEAKLEEKEEAGPT